MHVLVQHPVFQGLVRKQAPAPPTAVAIIGLPVDIPSIMASGVPSFSDVAFVHAFDPIRDELGGLDCLVLPSVIFECGNCSSSFQKSKRIFLFYTNQT